MSKQMRMFGVVMSAGFEAAGAMFASKWGSDWLDSNYPRENGSWIAILSVLALITVSYSCYVKFRWIVRSSKNSNH